MPILPLKELGGEFLKGSTRIEPTYALTAESVGNLHFDAARNLLYFIGHYGVSSNNSTAHIYQLDFTTGALLIIANAVAATLGDEGGAAAAMLTLPAGLQTDSNGVLHYSDGRNNRVKKLTRVP